MEIKDAIARVMARQHLSADQIAAVFGTIMEGQATPAQIGALLIALRMKGETPEELAGAARAMRARAVALECPEPEAAVDTCGTGGDASGTINVSTGAALVVAGAGVRVAKHGNRALTSRSGSADVLEALGVKVDAPVPVLEKCLREARIAFMFAPAFHAATRHVAGPRKELGTRTIFNLLGPMTNPAGVKNQVIGVFDGGWCEPVARALGLLGSRRLFVVHGDGGLDEIAVRGVTRYAQWNDGLVTTGELRPDDFGLREEDPSGLAGGDAAANARALRAVLEGAPGAARAAIVMSAGLALVAAGAADTPAAGARMAEKSIDSGAAMKTLERWAALLRGSA
jgi:anthranilate phosphoribosyltransferase